MISFRIIILLLILASMWGAESSDVDEALKHDKAFVEGKLDDAAAFIKEAVIISKGKIDDGIIQSNLEAKKQLDMMLSGLIWDTVEVVKAEKIGKNLSKVQILRISKNAKYLLSTYYLARIENKWQVYSFNFTAKDDLSKIFAVFNGEDEQMDESKSSENADENAPSKNDEKLESMEKSKGF